MAIAVVNQSGVLSSSYGASPRSIAIATPTLGDILLVGIDFSAASNGVALTDDQGNTYTQVLSFVDADGTTRRIFRSNNLTGTMPTSLSVSWTDGDSKFAYALMAEYSGVDGTTPVGTTGASTTGYGTTESISFTTASANEAVFTFNFNTSNDFTITEAGYTRLPTGSVNRSSTTNPDTGAAGAKTLTYTFTTAMNAIIGLVTLVPASAGGSVMPVIANHNMRRRA